MKTNTFLYSLLLSLLFTNYLSAQNNNKDDKSGNRFDNINFEETSPTFIMPSGDNVWVLDSLDNFKPKDVSDSTYLSSINYNFFGDSNVEAVSIKINANSFAVIKSIKAKDN